MEQINSTTRRGRVGHGVAQTLTTSPQQAVVEPFIVASRGRNPENPSDRTVGSPTVQRLEPNSQGICNTITTVLKDNYVAEPSFVNGDICRTVRSGGHGSTDRHSWDMVQCNNTLRIRKLTPKECFRLMDFDDADFEKAEAVNSNTQLYKQAGNSIVVAVPQYIIKALIEANIFIEKEKEMELKVKAPTFPEVIEFNFDELKQEITERASTYVNLVYGEEQIQDAKKDRATLNKFVKALSDERIKIKKECLKPYEDFEAKIKELDGIVSKAIANIDNQVKGYEEKKKQEKLEKIKEFWAGTEIKIPMPLTFEQIFNEKWLNASVSIKSIQEEITSRLEQIANDLETLANLPEFGFEAVEVYKTTLDLNKALNEGRRLSEIQKRKAEAERLKAEMEAEQARLAAEVEAQKAEVVGTVTAEANINGQAVPVAEIPVEVPAKQWVSFKALLTVAEAKALKDFFDDKGIVFEPI